MANLNISELDFDAIKENLKAFLSAQTEFTDYDFEGSGLSVLIDLLAYNTHYNAYLANMVVNEMFVDSAVKRASVVSLAKHLGYMPRSARGSRAILTVTVDNVANEPATLILPKFSSFTTSIDDTNYTFLTTKDYITSPVSGVYTFSDVEIVQGSYLTYSFTVGSSPGPQEKFTIPNKNVDTSTINVAVQKSVSDTLITYFTKADGIVGLSGSSTVYFIEENPEELHQIYFGDGILGKKLEAGNIVVVSYLVVDGSISNVSNLLEQQFSYGGTIGGQVPLIIVEQNSTGGADKESVDSIKFNALQYNYAKGRLVNKNDYAVYIRSAYSDVESVAVWGGEENTPPQYGKIFISLKPYEGFSITSTLKTSIKNNLLRDRQVLTALPEFVEPEIIYTKLVCNVKYQQSRTIKNPATLKNDIAAAIKNYFLTSLQQFDKNFYHSDLIQVIDAVDPSILSVNLEPSIQRRMVPVLNVENSYISTNTLKLYNPIHPNELSSTRFFILVGGVPTAVRFKDLPNTEPPDYNGTGTLLIYNDANNAIINQNAGIVNYATGEVTIYAFVPVGYTAGVFDIRITAGMQSPYYDISVIRNRLVALDDSRENPSAGRAAGLIINVSPV